MYFPFLELQKWCKRSAEIRRRNCTVLPYVFLTKRSRQRGQVMAILPFPRGTRTT